MVDKTYANLSAVTTIASADLVGVYPTGGPLSVIGWSNLIIQAGTDLGSTFLKVSNNLSDLNSAGVARGNLGLGTSSVINTGTTSGTIAVLGTGGKTPISTLPGGYLSKSGTYTVVAADNGKLIDCTSGTFTLTLPDASTVGDTFSVDVRNSGTGVITVAPAAGLIDGVASIAMAASATRTFVNDATNYFSTPEGPQGWVLLDTKVTTSGTNVVFSSISQAYSEIMFEVDSVIGSAGDSLTLAVSSDGASYSATWDTTGSGVSGFVGQISSKHYSSTITTFEAAMASASAAPYLLAPSSSAVKRVCGTASGVKYARFATPAGTFSSGTIRLYAR